MLKMVQLHQTGMYMQIKRLTVICVSQAVSTTNFELVQIWKQAASTKKKKKEP